MKPVLKISSTAVPGRSCSRKALGIALALILTVSVLPTGCRKSEGLKITVAEQYGLAYAPVQIMKEMGFLEAALHNYAADGQDIEVEWVKLANTSAVQEAMLADTLDVAFVGIPPFLIGRDQGMPWSIFTGLSESPVELLTNDPAIADLDGLVGAGKIALPQPGSIQHILLAMAAKQQLGDATVFDRQLVAMKHPDGLQSLLSSQAVVAQFTSPPYNFIAAESPGIHLLLTGEEATGEPFSFIVGIAEPEFLTDEKRLLAFREALDQAIDFINTNPDETMTILAASYELTLAQTEDYLYHRGLVYATSVRGVDRFASFMHDAGYLKETYHEDNVLWSND